MLPDAGYDGLGQLDSRTVTSGTAGNFSYVYDRWGNRWQQNVLSGSGPSPQFSFNTATNEVSGYSYDAAGNMTSNGLDSYTYDANGNVISVSGADNATYTYDALNRRVQVSPSGSDSLEFIYNLNGQRVSIWDGTTGSQIQGQVYWGTMPVEFYENGTAHFQFLDWQGTERVQTSYNGAVEGTYNSLPYGDGYSASGADDDAYHYAMLDQDNSSDEHAIFREYSNLAGCWMSPDPYSGSYNVGNPQSFNRYSYVMNNPLGYVDPWGLDCQGVQTIYAGGGGVSTGVNITSCDGGSGHGGDGGAGGPPSPERLMGHHGGGGGTGTGPSAPSNPVILQNPCQFQGRAMPPSAYAQSGQAVSGSPISSSLDVAMGWPRGGYLDAQPLASGNVFQNQAYGNYVFGAYMAGKGTSLNGALDDASAFSLMSGAYFTYINNGYQMDSNYPFLPAANVGNITNGYNASVNGTLCHN